VHPNENERRTQEMMMAFANSAEFEDDFRKVGPDATANLEPVGSDSNPTERASSESLYAAAADTDEDDLEDDEDDLDEDDNEDDDLEDDDNEELDDEDDDELEDDEDEYDDDEDEDEDEEEDDEE
jgi:hypothetical protein